MADNTLVVASGRWTQQHADVLKRYMEDAYETLDSDERNAEKFGSLPVQVVDVERFMCPGASRLEQPLQSLLPGFRIIYPASVTDDQVWAETVGWIRTWCRPDRRAFVRDTQLSNTGPERVDVIEVDETWLKDPKEAYPMGVDEVVDALAGRPKTMQNWFLTPFAQRMRDYVAYVLQHNEWGWRHPVMLSRADTMREKDPALKYSEEDQQRLLGFAVRGDKDTEPPALEAKEPEDLQTLRDQLTRNLAEEQLAAMQSQNTRYYQNKTRKLQGQIKRLEEDYKARKQGVTVVRRKEFQERLQFLDDVLAGRGERLDAERLFRLLNGGTELPDKHFWHAEAQRTWKIHADRKYEVKSIDLEGRNLSWPARMQLRILPERTRVRYIKLHYPEGAEHIISASYKNTRDFAQMLVPFHPKVVAKRSRVIGATLGAQDELSDLIASYSGKLRVAPVKLFR